MTRWVCGIALGLAALSSARGQAPASSEYRLGPVRVVSVGSGSGGRNLVRIDPVQSAIVAGTWKAPEKDDAIVLPGGRMGRWEAAGLSPDGTIDHPALRGGYAWTTVEVAADTVAVLEARGHAMVYVNGEPRAGDPYGYGFVRLPVALHKGTNGLLFQGARGPIQVRLTAPRSDLELDTADATLPDLLQGETEEAWGAVMVRNATMQRLDGLAIEAEREGAAAIRTEVPAVLPQGTRKVGFRMRGAAGLEPGEVSVRLTLRQGQGEAAKVVDTAKVTLRVRRAGESYRRTFRSAIDGSIQFYGVRPAVPVGPSTPALVLTLHGASVDAMGQADAYSSKSWAHLVAPTNRRPYGFDWEDWGRLDAYEVLADAQARLAHDPSRVYLTGHSMGGHGTWHLGTTDPDRFAAIAPSAGWISFTTYGGRAGMNPDSPLRELLGRPSLGDPMTLATNLSGLGVYILHGDADDNVPVSEARAMADRLAGFHRDWRIHEQKGAGHWWDSSDEPGADCVDWAPLFDFLARHVRPANEAVRQLEFTTTNPAVSSRLHWAEIEAQQRALRPSVVRLQVDPGQRRFTGTTENVQRLALDLGMLSPGAKVRVVLDEQDPIEAAWPEGSPARLWLEQGDQGRWKATQPPAAAVKGPHRGGPFKQAFQNRMILVYGTGGTDDEKAWTLAKARFDAETFWYRGNGSVEVVPDTTFRPDAEPDRNVILYGNASTNRAWPALLKDSPVQVEADRVLIEDGAVAGEDLACLFLRPRPGSDRAIVGVVAGTGLRGMRLTDRLAYLSSGVNVPDVIVMGSDMLERGIEGVRAAGTFGNDWGVGTGEVVGRAGDH